jgi:ferric-dicitrate binding protein FerR (iron transport regulator)
MRQWRNLVCGVMAVVLPMSLTAQDSARAILHSDGGVWLNGNPAPSSSAIFPNDLIQTQQGRSAKIEAYGSAITVQPETVVQFSGDELVLELILDHGGLQVDTSRGTKVRVNCITVSPLAQAWTRYDVTDVDGTVTVAAQENSVLIHYEGGSTRQSKQAAFADVTVHQGEQATRDEKCGASARTGDVVNGKVAILNNVWTVRAGVVAIGIITCWALCRGDDPLSPDKP